MRTARGNGSRSASSGIRRIRLAVELLGGRNLEKRAAELLGDDLVADVFTRLLGARRCDDELFRKVLGEVVIDPGGALSGVGQESIGIVGTLGCRFMVLQAS